MRIEVLVGSEDPVVYPLNLPKISVGTAENCEIIVNADGISRKHITIFFEGDQFFVADQGSTNGTFINEERLVPGRKVEFTSFFPVRLGDHVLISLLSDDEGSISIPFPTSPKKESTSSGINFNSPKSSGTSTIKFGDGTSPDSLKAKLQKNEIRKKASPSKSSPARSKTKSNIVPVMAVLLVLAAGYYNFFVMDTSSTDDVPVSEVGKIIKVDTPSVKEEPKADPDLVVLDDAPKKESFSRLIDDIKCTTDGEAYLCGIVPGANESKYGVVQSGLTYNVFINAEKYIAEARPSLKEPQWSNPEAVKEYTELLYTTAAYIFLYRYLPLLDEKKLGSDSKIAIGLFKPTNGRPEIEKVVIFYPKVFNREKPNFKETPLIYLKKVGILSFNDFKKKFLVY